MTTQEQDIRTIYLLLTRSGTCFSRLIHRFTNGEFTHASIGLEGASGAFYSFARKYPRLPFPGGLIREQADRGYFYLHPDTPCCLYELTVTEDTYQFLRSRLQEMYDRRKRYHYSVLGAVGCYFRRPMTRQRYKFCSEFVAEMLVESGAVELGKLPALTRPMDLCQLEELRPVHRGEVRSLMEAEAAASVWWALPIHK